MKGKYAFKDLGIPKIITQAVQSQQQFEHTTDATFVEIISKWLAQAPLRLHRESKRNELNNETLMSVDDPLLK
ncbi:unnamed protein product [Lasius platythorax]|uniref:Uncharacterized protein n=1 Tax=Lasius platythorax TaxID=488582 RepID=A0AAV2NL62_9HYME